MKRYVVQHFRLVAAISCPEHNEDYGFELRPVRLMLDTSSFRKTVRNEAALYLDTADPLEEFE